MTGFATAAEERAAIVAWLLAEAARLNAEWERLGRSNTLLGDYRNKANAYADAASEIERGKHHDSGAAA